MVLEVDSLGLKSPKIVAVQQGGHGGGRGGWGSDVMVSWYQRQVPPPAGGSCPRSRPGQSGTIPQQVQHPVRRSANPLPPSPHCHCPRHMAWAATGLTTQPRPHAGPCAHRAPNVFSSVKVPPPPPVSSLAQEPPPGSAVELSRYFFYRRIGFFMVVVDAGQVFRCAGQHSCVLHANECTWDQI